MTTSLHDLSTDGSSSDITVIGNDPAAFDNDKSLNTVLEQFFKDLKTLDDGSKSARCILCSTIVKQSTTSTYNYGRHVHRKHKKEMELWKAEVVSRKVDDQKKQPTINQSFGQQSNEKYSARSNRQVELTEVIVQDLIIDLGLPLSVVDHPAFLRAMNIVDPRFTVLSRRTLCRDTLPSTLNRVMTKVKQNWPHTGDNLRQQLEDTIAAFNIEDKLVRIVTDNASNNLKAFDELVIPGFEVYFEPEDDEDEHEDDADSVENTENHAQIDGTNQEERLRIPCFSHTLQLVVGDGLKDCEPAKASLAKVAAIAKFSHKSTSFAEVLQRENISIPIAVKTRWNSQHHTICKVLEISHILLNDLLRSVDRTDLILTARDIIILQEFASIFALFAEATTRSQADKTASISLVAPSILSIYFDLERERTNCKYLGSLCRTLVNSLRERFGGLLERCEVFADNNIKIKRRSTYDLYKDDLFLIAPFLDGRFKFNWILASDLLDSTKEQLTNTIKTLVLKAALQLHGSLNNTLEANVESSTTDHCDAEDESLSKLPNFKRKRLFSGYEGQKTPAKKKRSCVSEAIEGEISMFEKEDSGESSLIFKKKTTYPYLQKLATKVFCIPATSAPVERVFSSSGILMRPHRSRLSKNMLSMLTLLKCNRHLL
ncbi:unnamed protein product [Adineta ricciae]|uniref:HAT C-terminal dimerisation domain-containing protein n=1 Tax=Adineta ricciae TaxID=249248 RepID=A0A814MLA1_ADIRI|nr:unnamed protein product [Adineta ricciae]